MSSSSVHLHPYLLIHSSWSISLDRFLLVQSSWSVSINLSLLIRYSWSIPFYLLLLMYSSWCVPHDPIVLICFSWSVPLDPFLFVLLEPLLISPSSSADPHQLFFFSLYSSAISLFLFLLSGWHHIFQKLLHLFSILRLFWAEEPAWERKSIRSTCTWDALPRPQSLLI